MHTITALAGVAIAKKVFTYQRMYLRAVGSHYAVLVRLCMSLKAWSCGSHPL